MPIGITSTIKTTLEPRYDADGKVWLMVVPHDDLTALTPYKVIMNEYGWVTAALADDEYYYYVGVPAAAVDASEVNYCWVQIGGQCDDMVTASDTATVGQAYKVYDGTVVCTDADYVGGAGEFAVCRTAVSDAATACDVMLVPRIIIGTT